MATKQASLLLKKQMIELSKNASESFSAGLVDDDIYKWEVIIMGPPDTFYEGGYFKARMDFPQVRFRILIKSSYNFKNIVICFSYIRIR